MYVWLQMEGGFYDLIQSTDLWGIDWIVSELDAGLVNVDVDVDR
jgi:hypothetical protein